MRRSNGPTNHGTQRESRVPAGAQARDRVVGTRASEGLFKEQVGPAGDAFEVEADRVADAVVHGGPARFRRPGWAGASVAGATIQRKGTGADRAEGEEIRRAPMEAARIGQGPQAAPVDSDREAAGREPAQAAAAPALLVEDDGEVGRGQMRRSEFMAALRAEACGAVDGALAGTGRDSEGCPHIDYWFGYYEDRTTSQVERSLRRYAPEAAAATSASDYIRVVTARIRRAADTYARTGEVTGLPDDMAGATPAGAVLSALGGMFFKARPGGARPADPVSVRERLGPGRPLPGAVRAGMESAFAVSLGGVRLHTDATGAALADRLNARAFTVGGHVAFGQGEFRPGTLAGDALIAHELAHVVQQGGAGAAGDAGRAARGAEHAEPLERDADRSAASVMLSLWDRTRRSAGNARRQAAPALQSGLTLSRCGKSERQMEIDRLGNVQYAFLEKRRKEEEDKLKKDAEEDARKKGLPPPATTPKVELSDITKKDTATHGLPASPTTEWDSVVDKPAWEKDARDVIRKVEASVKGTEIEPLLKGVTIKFTPVEAFKGGFYASFQSSSSTFSVSMSWIKLAKKDPKNVWENIVHEAGGHRKYGTTYSSEIMDAALSRLSRAERKKITADSQKFFEAYEYPETEIYAALWQRRYQHPESGPAPETGGIDTDVNIEKRLKVMRDVLDPEVARAVVVELKRRVDENDQILARDKKFLVVKVKEILKINL